MTPVNGSFDPKGAVTHRLRSTALDGRNGKQMDFILGRKNPCPHLDFRVVISEHHTNIHYYKLLSLCCSLTTIQNCLTALYWKRQILVSLLNSGMEYKEYLISNMKSLNDSWKGQQNPQKPTFSNIEPRAVEITQQLQLLLLFYRP